VKTKEEDVQKVVEKGLGSIGRLRILRVLASGKVVSQTKYSLERKTGLKPIAVRKHLKILMETGWVKEHDYNPRVYTLNPDNPKTKVLVDFFKSVGYI
jgi:DNA-binding transcriptional ArsR family regulator